MINLEKHNTIDKILQGKKQNEKIKHILIWGQEKDQS